jgi:hypothetical protein
MKYYPRFENYNNIWFIIKWLVTPGNMAWQHPGISSIWVFYTRGFSQSSCYDFQTGNNALYTQVWLYLKYWTMVTLKMS